MRVELTPESSPGGPATLAGWPREPRDVSGVVIDVLRATSTLVVALDHGARRVVPLEQPAEALRLRDREPGVLACGERGGLIVAGFDLGNSPLDYSAERVRGRTLAFASTNGSRAMRAIAGSGERWLASFVNATAAADALFGRGFVRIVCAGKLGRFALEDAACAGLLCVRLAARGAVLEGGAARLARAIAPEGPAEVRSLVSGCQHARELRGLGPGPARDVEWCATLDALPHAFQF